MFQQDLHAFISALARCHSKWNPRAIWISPINKKQLDRTWMTGYDCRYQWCIFIATLTLYVDVSTVTNEFLHNVIGTKNGSMDQWIIKSVSLLGSAPRLRRVSAIRQCLLSQANNSAFPSSAGALTSRSGFDARILSPTQLKPLQAAYFAPLTVGYRFGGQSGQSTFAMLQ